ncbi:hypothetical protein SPLC1_S360480 [Arthrospira platensis C1]|nr:hypothetical protein SPLC1_S360480 [Arthrospira platensis C1]
MTFLLGDFAPIFDPKNCGNYADNYPVVLIYLYG